MSLFTENNPMWQSFESKFVNKINSKLRSAPEADKSGSYHPIIVLKNSVIDRGETLNGDVFLSGYGSISHPKLAIQGPVHVFAPDKSQYRQGFEIVEQNSRKRIVFAGRAIPGLFGVIQLCAAVEADGVVAVDMFSDLTSGTHKIYAEDRVGNAPLTFELEIAKKCRPGAYELAFVLTYYNGESWVSVNEKATFTVRNLLQRLDWKVAGFALFAAAVSMIADSVGALENLSFVWTMLPSLLK